MEDLKACIVCFTMDVKLLSMDINQLRQKYYLLTGLQLQKGNGMPEYLCYQCCGYMTRFIKFRDKCHRAYFVLDQLLQKDNEITKASLKAVDRDSFNIKPFLSYFNRTNVHHEQHDIKGMKNNHCMNSIRARNPQDIANRSLVKQEDNNVNNERKKMIEIDTSIVYNSNNDEEMNAQSSSYNAYETQVFDDNDNDNYLDSDDNENMSRPVKSEEQPLDKSQEADGSVHDTEYATMHAMSRNEAQAAVTILKTIGLGKHVCNVCERRFKTEDRLKEHFPMHDRLTANGRYFCDLCNYYYKTSFLLKTHMTEKHMYKYVCKKCPEVSFDRITAKQHYILSHLRKHNDIEWDLVRPSWLMAKGGMRRKGVTAAKPKLRKRKLSKLPADIVYTPVLQEEQYARIEDRKKTKNYKESQYICDLCFKGFKDEDTYKKHMKKHDPVNIVVNNFDCNIEICEHCVQVFQGLSHNNYIMGKPQAISGDLQCDMCKLYFKNHLQIYYHMKHSHLSKFSCQLCDYVCSHRGQALNHYKFHNNVTYKCPHCPLEFKKLMTRQTHVRIKHPSSFICNLCGHSFVSAAGLNCHKQISHTAAEEVGASSQVPVDKTSSLYCADCDILFVSDAAFETHLGSSKNHATANVSVRKRARQTRDKASRAAGRPRRAAAPADAVILNTGIATATTCEICNKFLANDVQARKHYSAEHPGKEYLKRYMCDVCGHTTKQYAFLIVHMRTHTNEKPFKCPQCDRRFKQTSHLNRHMVVHAAEKPYECHICQGRFSQKHSVKMHIQTVHMKIPYAPWDKKNRKQRNELAAFNAFNADLQSQLPGTHTSF